MKTVPIVTDESESLCHQLNLLPVDEVPDAKREMHLHSTDTLCGNRQTAFNELNSLTASLSRTTGRTYTAPPQRFDRHC